MLPTRFYYLVVTSICFALANASAVTLEMVTVGNLGNAADTTGFGNVSHSYKIGKYEVTIGQWVEFLNTAAKSDPYGLYNPSIISTQISAGISRSGVEGNFSYSAIDNPIGQTSANRPITQVSFYDAARFANWMHNGQGTGDTEDGAYRISTGGVAGATRTGGVSTYTTSGPTTLSVGDQVSISGFTNGGSAGSRFNVTGIVTSLPAPNQFSIVNTFSNGVAEGVGTFTAASSTHAPNAKFWIPTENEWYKAAYYSPALNAGSGGYFQYGTQSNTAPGQSIGNSPNQANWSVNSIYAVGPSPLNTSANYVANVGSYSGSVSAYGLFDMTGNVREFTETIAGESLNSPGSARMWRGGGYNDGSSRSTSSYRDDFPSASNSEFSSLGFRLASSANVPGDFDLDGDVDGRDFLFWQQGDSPSPLSSVDLADWQSNYGAGSFVALQAVPEPTSVAIAYFAVAVAGPFWRIRRPGNLNH